ncbi:DUF1214 domain-containing protein [Aliivibrio fischeri]|uniref:DUF1254 domain-containing protein n=1 Tax=Aliivibrio fischeri TaxID=668 RepID=UPI001F1885B3|nr:DUF1254 domain-containing protein [Aliivibrio fischeri]MCE7578468.1 DUF1214 domain-containing protein [Aliivibrio fischeri]MCE7590830.1 DUF1214 domain-containing protein [Aliivibrio fischeri]
MKKLSLLLLASTVSSSLFASTLLPVTESNYEKAESDLSFSNITKLVGSNAWFHFPKLTPLDNQTVVRMNRDTIYSGYVADVSKGGTVTILDTNGRYLSVMIVQNDHYIDQVFTKPGTYEIKSDTDFAMIVARTQIDPNDPSDINNVKRIQNQITVKTNSHNQHKLPNYDLKQLVSLRHKLVDEGKKFGSLNGMQGARGTVGKRMHLYGTALGWGLLPDKNAQYLSYYSQGQAADATKCITATYKQPPVTGNGFYSITIYNKEGWIANERSVLNKNNLKFNQDGSFTVNYGNCPENAINHVPVTDNWDMLMRVYEPDMNALKQYKLPKVTVK